MLAFLLLERCVHLQRIHADKNAHDQEVEAYSTGYTVSAATLNLVMPILVLVSLAVKITEVVYVLN